MSNRWTPPLSNHLSIRQGTVANRIALFSPKSEPGSPDQTLRPCSRTPSALKTLSNSRDKNAGAGNRASFGRRREESFGAPTMRGLKLPENDSTLDLSLLYGNSIRARRMREKLVQSSKGDTGPNYVLANDLYSTPTRRANLSRPSATNSEAKTHNCRPDTSQGHIIWPKSGQNTSAAASVFQSQLSTPTKSPLGSRLAEQGSSGNLAPWNEDNGGFTSRPSLGTPSMSLEQIQKNAQLVIDCSSTSNSSQYQLKRTPARQQLHVDQHVHHSLSESSNSSSSKSALDQPSDEKSLISRHAASSSKDGSEAKSRGEIRTPSGSESLEPIHEPLRIKHCRPKSGRTPKFLTDDSLVENFQDSAHPSSSRYRSKTVDRQNESEEPLIPAKYTPAKSPSYQTLNFCPVGLEDPLILGPRRSHSAQSQRSANTPESRLQAGEHDEDDVFSDDHEIGMALRPKLVQASKSSEDIQRTNDLISSPPAPLYSEPPSAAEGQQTPWRKSSLSVRKQRAAPPPARTRKEEPRRTSIASFIAALNTPIKQWSFSERWGQQAKSHAAPAGTFSPGNDGAPLTRQSSAQSNNVSGTAHSPTRVTSAETIPALALPDKRGKGNESLFASFEAGFPRDKAKLGEGKASERVSPLASIEERDGGRGNDGEGSMVASSKSPKKPVEDRRRGEITGLSVIVTFDSGLDVVVKAEVAGKEWDPSVQAAGAMNNPRS